MTRLTTALGALATITLGLLAAAFDEPEPTLDQRVYCEHVEAWYASHGTKGWPDYLHTYEDSCPWSPYTSTATGRPAARC